MFKLRFIVALVCCVSGCPDIESSGPSPHCTKAHEKCAMPNGVLGICDTEGVGGAQEPPRLVCRSQH